MTLHMADQISWTMVENGAETRQRRTTGYEMETHILSGGRARLDIRGTPIDLWFDAEHAHVCVDNWTFSDGLAEPAPVRFESVYVALFEIYDAAFNPGDDAFGYQPSGRDYGRRGDR